MDTETLAKTAYSQLCESYRKIDDFRAKLLGLLPAATGAGILLTSMETKELPSLPDGWSRPVAIFGFLITCGLFCYEIYGIRKCAELIRAGQKLEIAGNVHGQFCSRPPAVGRWINEPLAAAIIYPVVLASWFVVFFLPPSPLPPSPVPTSSSPTSSAATSSEPTSTGHGETQIARQVWVGAVLLVVAGFLGVQRYDVSLRKRFKTDCDACGKTLGIEKGRVTTSLDRPDYWLCPGCSNVVKRWIGNHRERLKADAGKHPQPGSASVTTD